ncbi:2-amino-4-hydroxy-6-hydroxymethyldihydropteridine diphosphokinase [Salipiger bermudensis]|uniref:2-amino-4-hydroxy-6- hydroxymethyldihydropteridine diphosphokinase n=1 Tax=Salipiger bermudensis TaxID=344736 RepID=UPI001C99B72C|nr:2-amino-4-hydroxy-6-hydroxymethyldihydropteridine diphosphokinase [Salipiger bermudensis]MBY6002911.1 2-amino-4-hydroxy-6-hydroxymethyldihydropteridine diphosphokinase [Salipiger bermudensis]
MAVEQEKLIALGANLSSAIGSPAETLHAAIKELSAAGEVVAQVSRFYATPCFPAGAGPDYVNACLVSSGEFSAADTLALLHRIERKFGRERQQRWGSRSLDLDLIAHGQVVLPDAASQKTWRMLPLEEQKTRAPEQLILPHPRMHERAFVLVPLCDVAPDWRHPLLGKTVRELCAALPQADRDEVRPL